MKMEKQHKSFLHMQWLRTFCYRAYFEAASLETPAYSSQCIPNGVIIDTPPISLSGSNLAAMRFGHQVTSSTSLQIPPQPLLRNPHQILLDTNQPVLIQAIINPKQGMDGSLQTPQSPKTCGSPGLAGKECWSLDMRVAMFLLTLAGVVILLLLYRLLQLRHRCVGLHVTQ